MNVFISFFIFHLLVFLVLKNFNLYDALVGALLVVHVGTCCDLSVHQVGCR